MDAPDFDDEDHVCEDCGSVHGDSDDGGLQLMRPAGFLQYVQGLASDFGLQSWGAEIKVDPATLVQEVRVNFAPEGREAPFAQRAQIKAYWNPESVALQNYLEDGLDDGSDIEVDDERLFVDLDIEYHLLSGGPMSFGEFEDRVRPMVEKINAIRDSGKQPLPVCYTVTADYKSPPRAEHAVVREHSNASIVIDDDLLAGQINEIAEILNAITLPVPNPE